MSLERDTLDLRLPTWEEASSYTLSRSRRGSSEDENVSQHTTEASLDGGTSQKHADSDKDAFAVRLRELKKFREVTSRRSESVEGDIKVPVQETTNHRQSSTAHTYLVDTYSGVAANSNDEGQLADQTPRKLTGSGYHASVSNHRPGHAPETNNSLNGSNDKPYVREWKPVLQMGKPAVPKQVFGSEVLQMGMELRRAEPIATSKMKSPNTNAKPTTRQVNTPAPSFPSNENFHRAVRQIKELTSTTVTSVTQSRVATSSKSGDAKSLVRQIVKQNETTNRTPTKPHGKAVTGQNPALAMSANMRQHCEQAKAQLSSGKTKENEVIVYLLESIEELTDTLEHQSNVHMRHELKWRQRSRKENLKKARRASETLKKTRNLRSSFQTSRGLIEKTLSSFNDQFSHCVSKVSQIMKDYSVNISSKNEFREVDETARMFQSLLDSGGNDQDSMVSNGHQNESNNNVNVRQEIRKQFKERISAISNASLSELSMLEDSLQRSSRSNRR